MSSLTARVERLSLSTEFPLLLAYPFLMPLMLEFLSDHDVLQSLIITGKVLKPSLIGYRVKGWQTVARARDIAGHHHYLSIQTTWICGWRGEGLKFCPALKKLEIDHNFDQLIDHCELPTSLQEIHCDIHFNQPILKNMLPPYLKRLSLSYCYNHALQIDTLPSSLEFVDFGQAFDQELIPGLIPYGVSEICFGDGFGRSSFQQPLVPGVIPNSVTKLTLNTICNHLLLPGSLPSSLTSLSFQKGFVNFLVRGDKHLSSSSRFTDKLNQPFRQGVLPNSLTHLCLNDEFNQPFLPSTLPARLKHLEFGECYQPLTEDIMPHHIEHLAMGSLFANSLWLPQTLKTLEIQVSITDITFINSFPLSLHRIELFDPEEVLPVGFLPTSIRELIISQCIQIGSIPDSVIDLFYRGCDEIPIGAIPSNVKRLRFGSGFDQPIVTRTHT